MKLIGVRAWALLTALLFMGTIAASDVGKTPEPAGASEEAQPTAGTSPRIVLVEEFTAQWCPPCVSAAHALTRVEDEYGKSEIVVVAYHASNDPFYDANVIGPRLSIFVTSNYYLPTVIVDGGGPTNSQGLWTIGSSSPDAAYDSYTADIGARSAVKTDLQITPSGDLTPTTAFASATVHASDAVTESNLFITFVLTEDNQYYMGTNGNPLHRVVARALYERPISIAQGDTVKVSHTFAVNPAWESDKLGFVVFVQTHTRSAGWLYNGNTFYNAEVLQAAKWRYVKPSILYVRGDQKTDYVEFMEKPLTYDAYSFENWDVLDASDMGAFDFRGSPNGTEMEEFGAVLWVTGSDGTIDATNMADIAAYLSAGGTLLVTGENVTTDISDLDPTWLSANLHASHGTDPAGAKNMSGVVGDPITDPFNSTIMTFTGLSPDAVDPANGGVTMLNYPGPVSAAVRADHAPGSRVAIMGMNYYEGSDLDATKRTLLANSVTWFDGAGGPKVSVVSPNGGESYSSGDIGLIEWKAVDVSIPKDGVDLYYTTDLTSPTWNLIASGEPNDGVYRWTVPDVETTNCGVKVVVRDGDPNTPDGVAMSAGPCTIGSPNMAISKSVSNPSPHVYDTITYSITMSNTGLTTGYAEVTDTLPGVVTYLADDGNSTGVSMYYQSNRTIVWRVAVPPSVNAVLQISVFVELSAPLVNVPNAAFYNSSSEGGGTPQSGMDSTVFMIPNLDTWSIDLTVGKHLISIPMKLLDYRVGSVLASIAGNYDYIQTYTGDPASPWISHKPGRQYDSLVTLPHGTAFWINIVTPCRLTVAGARPVHVLMALDAGWNMIGFPSYNATYTVGDLKASLGQTGIRVEGFTDFPPYNLRALPDSYTMRPGEGYWVYVRNAGTWDVPL